MATAVPTTAFDWGKCIFCQKHSRGLKVRCHAESTLTDLGTGYASLSCTLDGYAQLAQMPEYIRSLDHLVNIRENNVDNDGELIVESDIEPKTSGKIPRLSRSSTGKTADPGNVVCFFCEQSGSDLHQVMTFSVDHKVRQCATVTKVTKVNYIARQTENRRHDCLRSKIYFVLVVLVLRSRVHVD